MLAPWADHLDPGWTSPHSCVASIASPLSSSLIIPALYIVVLAESISISSSSSSSSSKSSSSECIGRKNQYIRMIRTRLLIKKSNNIGASGSFWSLRSTRIKSWASLGLSLPSSHSISAHYWSWTRIQGGVLNFSAIEALANCGRAPIDDAPRNDQNNQGELSKLLFLSNNPRYELTNKFHRTRSGIYRAISGPQRWWSSQFTCLRSRWARKSRDSAQCPVMGLTFNRRVAKLNCSDQINTLRDEPVKPDEIKPKHCKPIYAISTIWSS